MKQNIKRCILLVKTLEHRFKTVNTSEKLDRVSSHFQKTIEKKARTNPEYSTILCPFTFLPISFVFVSEIWQILCQYDNAFSAKLSEMSTLNELPLKRRLGLEHNAKSIIPKWIAHLYIPTVFSLRNKRIRRLQKLLAFIDMLLPSM